MKINLQTLCNKQLATDWKSVLKCIRSQIHMSLKLRIIQQFATNAHVSKILNRKQDLFDVPEKLRNEEIYMAWVEINGYHLADVPRDSRTEDVCYAAVIDEGCALKYVINQTPRIIEAAMKNDLGCFEHIINKSNELCIKAITMDPYVIEAITNPTEELCLAAVQKNGEVIRFIKDPSEAVCIAAVTKFDYAITFLSNPSEKTIDAAKKSKEIRLQKDKYWNLDC